MSTVPTNSSFKAPQIPMNAISVEAAGFLPEKMAEAPTEPAAFRRFNPWRSVNIKDSLKLAIGRIKQDLQFSNIMLVDMAASISYALTTILILYSDVSSRSSLIMALCLAGLFILIFSAKVGLVIYLERAGGCARQFVGSEILVTRGVYAFSRNPVYVLTLIQSALWSLALIVLTWNNFLALFGLVTAWLLFCAHFWGIDRLIIPKEEAALRARHPTAFEEYARRVRRWI